MIRSGRRVFDVCDPILGMDQQIRVTVGRVRDMRWLVRGTDAAIPTAFDPNLRIETTARRRCGWPVDYFTSNTNSPGVTRMRPRSSNDIWFGDTIPAARNCTARILSPSLSNS